MPTSQAQCSSLLEECFEISQEIKANEESKHVASSLKPIYDRLGEIRAELESLVLTHRWSLRETDLWNYSLSLQEIDKMRIDGKFVDQEGNRPPGQYVSFFCHQILFKKPNFLAGASLSLEAMLRTNLSAVIIERTGFRRVDAYCMF